MTTLKGLCSRKLNTRSLFLSPNERCTTISSMHAKYFVALGAKIATNKAMTSFPVL